MNKRSNECIVLIIIDFFFTFRGNGNASTFHYPLKIKLIGTLIRMNTVCTN